MCNKVRFLERPCIKAVRVGKKSLSHNRHQDIGDARSIEHLLKKDTKWNQYSGEIMCNGMPGATQVTEARITSPPAPGATGLIVCQPGFHLCFCPPFLAIPPFYLLPFSW